MHKVAVGVLGASGYTGRELCGLVARHPEMELVFAAANEQRGRSARFGGRDVTFVASEDASLQGTDLVFSALPHGASAEWVGRAREAGARVVDLSSDFRPGNPGTSQNGTTVPYGLTELSRSVLADAALVANPGCYPTAVLIALAPLLAGGLVAPGATITVNAASGVTGAGFTPRPELMFAQVAEDFRAYAVLIALAPLLAGGLVTPGATITVNAASGVTGAGFAPRPELMFAQVAEDFRAYAVGNTHRHLAEMKSFATKLGGDADILFTPHLLPVSRGILATITVPVTRLPDNVLAPWLEAYSGEPFVEVAAEPPTLKDVVHRNVVRISAVAAAGVRQPTLVVFAAIDNLMKGAAGQAVQNANVMLGFPEPMGLPA